MDFQFISLVLLFIKLSLHAGMYSCFLLLKVTYCINIFVFCFFSCNIISWSSFHNYYIIIFTIFFLYFAMFSLLRIWDCSLLSCLPHFNRCWQKAWDAFQFFVSAIFFFHLFLLFEYPVLGFVVVVFPNESCPLWLVWEDEFLSIEMFWFVFSVYL